jgi:prophage regulatory protein
MNRAMTKPSVPIPARPKVDEVPTNVDGPLRAHKSAGGPESAVNGCMPQLRLLRFADVKKMTGLSRSTIFRLQHQGAFPNHHRVSRKRIGWIEEDVINWVRSRVVTCQTGTH